MTSMLFFEGNRRNNNCEFLPSILLLVFSGLSAICTSFVSVVIFLAYAIGIIEDIFGAYSVISPLFIVTAFLCAPTALGLSGSVGAKVLNDVVTNRKTIAITAIELQERELLEKKLAEVEAQMKAEEEIDREIAAAKASRKTNLPIL
jgi:hypothetical protein